MVLKLKNSNTSGGTSTTLKVPSTPINGINLVNEISLSHAVQIHKNADAEKIIESAKIFKQFLLDDTLELIKDL